MSGEFMQNVMSILGRGSIDVLKARVIVVRAACGRLDHTQYIVVYQMCTKYTQY